MSHRVKPKIPVQARAKKTKESPSFKQTHTSKLRIDRGGKPEDVRVIGKFENPDSISLKFYFQHGHSGSFRAKRVIHTQTWNLWHRFLPYSNRGYYLGRTGIRYIETMIKKRGGKKVTVYTNQRDVLETLLKLNYSIKPSSQTPLKKLLNIPRNASLPKGKALAKLVHTTPIVFMIDIEIERELN